MPTSGADPRSGARVQTCVAAKVTDSLPNCSAKDKARPHVHPHERMRADHPRIEAVRPVEIGIACTPANAGSIVQRRNLSVWSRRRGRGHSRVGGERRESSVTVGGMFTDWYRGMRHNWQHRSLQSPTKHSLKAVPTTANEGTPGRSSEPHLAGGVAVFMGALLRLVHKMSSDDQMDAEKR